MALDPRTKIIFLVVVSVLVVIINQPFTLIAIFISVLGFAFFVVGSRRKIFFLIGILIIGTWLTIYGQAIFYNRHPRTILFTIVKIHFYREGFFYGFVQSIRFSTTISTAFIVITTTQSRDLLLGLIRLRLPYGVAFMATTAIRYVPMIADEMKIIVQSQRLRGFRYFRWDIFWTLRGIFNMMRPILANNIRRATNLAEAIESRGFSAERIGDRTFLRQLNFRFYDLVILIFLIVIGSIFVISKIIFLLYANGIFYSPNLRSIYIFTHHVIG